MFSSTNLEALIHENDKYRVHGVINGLNELRQVNEEFKIYPKYDYTYPTLVKTVIPMKFKTISQEKYSSILYDNFPVLQQILSIDGTVLAGGAAIWPFYQKDKPNDFDIFLYNQSYPSIDDVKLSVNNIKYSENELDEEYSGEDYHKIITSDKKVLTSRQIPEQIIHEQEQNNWNKLQTLINIVLTYYKDHEINQQFNNGLFTISINYLKIKIQFILRDYVSISNVLHGFDLSSCAVGFDGITTYFTKLGAWSHLTKLNFVWPSYRSTTYENRLIKYFKKGFGVIFIHLSEFKLGLMELPNLNINVQYCSHNYALGNILNNNIFNVESDYDNSLKYYYYQSLINIKEKNILNIINNMQIYNIIGYKYSHSNFTKNLINLDTVKTIKTIKDLIPLNNFTGMINHIIYESFHINKRAKKISVNFYKLKIICNLNDNQIFKLSKQITKLNKLLETEVVSIDYSCFSDGINEQIEKYQLIQDQEIHWWLPFKFSEPFTGSLNPIMNDPCQWYGDFTSSGSSGSSFTSSFTSGGSSGFTSKCSSGISGGGSSGFTSKCSGISGGNSFIRGGCSGSSFTSILIDDNEIIEVNKHKSIFAASLLLLDTIKENDCEMCILCLNNINSYDYNIIKLACGHLFHLNKEEFCIGVKSWINIKHKCPICSHHNFIPKNKIFKLTI